MKTCLLMVVPLLIGLFSGCLTPRPEPPTIRIEETAVAVTPIQKAFLAAVSGVKPGMTSEQVREILGEPQMKGTGRWLYELRADAVRGGRYISAVMEFDNGTLARGLVRGGHIRRVNIVR